MKELKLRGTIRIKGFVATKRRITVDVHVLDHKSIVDNFLWSEPAKYHVQLFDVICVRNEDQNITSQQIDG